MGMDVCGTGVLWYTVSIAISRRKRPIQVVDVDPRGKG